jgi:hypothetical protein
MNSIYLIVPILISIITLAVAVKTYLRLSTFENENFLFRHKIEKYNELLTYLAQNITYMAKEVDDFYDYRFSDTVDSEEVDRIRDRMFAAISETELIIVSKVAFVSEGVVNAVERYIDALSDNNFINYYSQNDYDEEDILANNKRDLNAISRLEDCFYELADEMRNDSGIEPLIKKLHNRIGSKPAHSR